MDIEKERILMGSVREVGKDILRNRVGMSSLTNLHNSLRLPIFMFYSTYFDNTFLLITDLCPQLSQIIKKNDKI